ncbi:MAG: lipoprotein intramolecular transacylase Lit, partial [Panacagrimonas sp.]
MSRPYAKALGLVWGLSLVLCSLYIAWRVLAAMDFAYPLLYDVIGIEQTIAKTGPQNRIRPGFHTTTRAERERVFAAIARAIRDDGQGLEALRYQNASGRDLGLLLTEAERVHLHDVARLVRRVEPVGLLGSVAFVLLSVLLWRSRTPLPTGRRVLLGSVAVLCVGGLALLLIGPRVVFYQLHEWIFPAGHQWFFYYQESLMSMMMRAPVLFGGIGLIWLGLGLGLMVLMYVALQRLLSRAAAPLHTPGT